MPVLYFHSAEGKQPGKQPREAGRALLLLRVPRLQEPHVSTLPPCGLTGTVTISGSVRSRPLAKLGPRVTHSMK